MKFIFIHIFLIFLSTTQSSFYSSLNNVLSYLTKRNSAALNNDEYRRQQQNIDERIAKAKAKIINRAKEYEVGHNSGVEPKVEDLKESYYKDPMLNFVSRRSRTRKKKDKTSTESSESSSSLEGQNWKEEWKEQWLLKKYEALNSTAPPGDSVNMVAARPWGVPCGDPNQHDVPWGTCMLPMECDAEYRIYRGDYFCGRTQFICCALQLTSYDMYQGFDASLGDSGLATDSYEKKSRGGSRETKHRQNLRNKKKRRRERLKRKRKIKTDIKKIIHEIKKILNKSFKNGTTEKKKKTKKLKKFIKFLKKKYKNERIAVQNLHNLDLIKTDESVQKKIDEIRDLNRNFITNGTFRDIVVNGTVNKQIAKLLLEAYPELHEYLKTRRSDAGKVSRDYEYDVEYGLLYH